ncbi:MAG TPA: LptE family protein [Candidatus Kapabacteria bacterium]|nr:LptE family protein [Candidatus Kapabacteria bacterium]
MQKKLISLIIFKKSVFAVLPLFILLSGCYSFTGSSIPEHIKTIYISSIKDNSGYGNPNYREKLTQNIIDNFRRDNSLELVEAASDSRLNIIISSIRDETSTVKAGELEKERKMTITCEAEYIDNIKRISFWKKNFSNYSIYSLDNAQANREQAISDVLQQISEDIMLAVVSGW